MMGDIVPLKDGTLLMSFGQDGAIAAVKSHDQGKSWGRPFVLVAKPRPPAKGTFAHPSFLRLPGGDIFLSYIYTTYPATPYYAHNYYRRSADDGRTWTEQFLMTPSPGYVLVHNDRLHLLSTGRMLAMAEYKAHMPSTEDHSGYVGMSFFSDDQGYSWQASRNTVDMRPVEVQEADAVELKDGRIMMFAYVQWLPRPRLFPRRRPELVEGRADPGAEDALRGASLGAAHPPDRRPALRVDQRTIGRSAGSEDRAAERLSTAISRDEGKTFLHQRNIARDPDDDFGYQCIKFLGDDLVLVGYHAREGLRVARIGVDWFYGK